MGSQSLIKSIKFPVLQAVAVTAEWDAFLDLFFYPVPGVASAYHVWDIAILLFNVVELKNAIITQAARLTLQSLFVLQKLLSILVDTFFGISSSHV